MKLTDAIIGLGQPISYSPGLARVCGIKECIFICQLIYWLGKESKNHEGEIHKTREKIEEELGMSFGEQLTARKNLVKLGWLSEREARLEHKMFYRPNLDAINDAWDKGESLRHSRGNGESAPPGERNPLPPERTTLPSARTREEETENTAVSTTENTSSAKASSPAASAGRAVADHCPYLQIVTDYHEHAPTLPACRGLPDKRKKAIRAAWLESKRVHPSAPTKQLCELFTMAEVSDYLTRRDVADRNPKGEHYNWRATFDWLLNPNNAVKVLEGNYANRQKQNNLADKKPAASGSSAVERWGGKVTKLNL